MPKAYGSGGYTHVEETLIFILGVECKIFARERANVKGIYDH